MITKINIAIRAILICLIIGAYVGFNIYVLELAVGERRARVETVQTEPITPVLATIDRQELYTLVNQVRVDNGLAPFTVSPVLEVSACTKANDMLTQDYWAHDSPTGVTPWYFFDQAGYAYSYAGENLAHREDDARSIVDAWLASPSHRDTMLSDYVDMGICAVQGEYMGMEDNIVVNHFGVPR